jgi:hypothetical protein
MNSAVTFTSILLALLLGVGIALIRPAQPVQNGMMAKKSLGVFAGNSNNALDNENIMFDPNIQPARKCTSQSPILLFFV